MSRCYSLGGTGRFVNCVWARVPDPFGLIWELKYMEIFGFMHMYTNVMYTYMRFMYKYMRNMSIY